MKHFFFKKRCKSRNRWHYAINLRIRSKKNHTLVSSITNLKKKPKKTFHTHSKDKVRMMK